MSHKIFDLAYSELYPLYVNKVTRKGRSTAELDQVITWLTGYTPEAHDAWKADPRSLRTFFAEAPQLHPKRDLVTGTICGVKIAELDDPLMKLIRQMDKLVDELAKGRPMEKVLRSI